jgi:hypothetical protein
MNIENGRLRRIDTGDIQNGSLIVPEEVTHIDDFAFSGCTGLTHITLPAGLTAIGNYAFSRCTGLTHITLPAGVTTIGRQAFICCTRLTHITLPAGLTAIGNSAFSCCTGLTHITSPAGLTTIGGQAFYGCTSLTHITLPAGLTTIGDDAFSVCTKLNFVIIDSDNPVEIERLKALLPDALKDKVISKREHIQKIRFEVALATIFPKNEGNVFNTFFSPEARKQPENICDINLLGEIVAFV